MKNFEDICEELQNVENNELNVTWEEAQKESKKTKKITIIVCLVINIILIILFNRNGRDNNYIIYIMPMIVPALIINIFAIIVINILFSKNKIKFNTKYKEIVIPRLISNFYNNVEYFPNKPLPEYIYENLQYEYYDTYESEDYFEGYIDNKYSIQMAEVLTQKEERYEDSDGKTQTRTITMFNGLFSKILMQKSIKSEIKIMQNGTFYFDKRLKMDSSEFEKLFDVKASESIIGMQLLTADVMEELIKFYNNTKIKFDIYIKENELYLRFHSGEMFEAGKIKNGPLDEKVLRKYFSMLNFTYNLADKLINVVNEIEI